MERELEAVDPGVVAGDDRVRGVLGAMQREDFMLSVKRAEADAVDALEARDDMLRWAKRLQPYLDRDPHMTVAAAVQLYLRAQANMAPRQADS